VAHISAYITETLVTTRRRFRENTTTAVEGWIIIN